jgi:hypothetical protein
MLAAPSLSDADLPTPAELDYAPELAILVALERSVPLAVVALIAAHPALRDGLDLDERDTTPLLSWLADDIARQLEALGVSLSRYRQAFAYARLRQTSTTIPDEVPL